MDAELQIAEVFENNTYPDLLKIRWLYFYVCKLFSYDIRYIFARDNLKQEIYNKTIDVKNIEDFEIVCYTMSKLLVDVLSSYGYDSEIIREYKDIDKMTHAYAVVKCQDYVLKLDPTKRHDLTRVKINSNTLDFTLLNESAKFIDELKECDSIITNDYKDIDKEWFYDSETIGKLVHVVEEDVKNRNLPDGETFYEKIDYVFHLINTRTDLKRYDDIDYYFSYLIKKFKLNQKTDIVNGETVTTKVNRVKPAVFFNSDDKTMRDMINLSIIQYEGTPPVCYVIKKEGENFVAREIFREEAIEILKQYTNPTCQFMFESAALKLPTGNKGSLLI